MLKLIPSRSTSAKTRAEDVVLYVLSSQLLCVSTTCSNKLISFHFLFQLYLLSVGPINMTNRQQFRSSLLFVQRALLSREGLPEVAAVNADPWWLFGANQSTFLHSGLITPHLLQFQWSQFELEVSEIYHIVQHAVKAEGPFAVFFSFSFCKAVVILVRPRMFVDSRF